MSLASRVRALLRKNKPGYGTVDTDESITITNRAAARNRLSGRGPFQHFRATTKPSGSPYGSRRARQKRVAARKRVLA